VCKPECCEIQIATKLSKLRSAVTVGRGFMTDGRARARLGKAVAGIIARGGERLDPAAIGRVFD
jgi:hypothetical protein